MHFVDNNYRIIRVRLLEEKLFAQIGNSPATEEHYENERNTPLFLVQCMGGKRISVGPNPGLSEGPRMSGFKRELSLSASHLCVQIVNIRLSLSHPEELEVFYRFSLIHFLSFTSEAIFHRANILFTDETNRNTTDPF